MDVGVRGEREEVHAALDNALGLLHHLAFGDPDGGFRDGDGEVVDLDAVELLDIDLDRIIFLVREAQCDAAVAGDGLAQDVVLEAAQREIAFGQEVAAATGGVRVSEEEYQQLQEKISESGKNQQEYILSCVLEKQIVNTDGIKELIPELKRIGNNLNQIAKRCNEGGMLPSEAEVRKHGEELNKVWQSLRRYLQRRA